MNIISTRRGRIAVSWIVCLTLIVASFAGPFSQNNAQASAVAPPITVDKEVVDSEWVDKDLGIAKVKLTVESQDIETTINTPLTTRIVLVLDYSGSMEGSKINKLKEVATDFVDDMLLLDRVEIGVVLLSSSIIDSLDFTDDADALKDIIEDNDAEGATLTQAGIRTAQTMLDTVTADNEFMIVLSDGEPTLSYKGTVARAATQADRDLNYDDEEWPFVIEEFSNDIVGSGGDYSLNTRGWDYRYYVNSYRVTNNGFATVSEALLAKQKHTTIFSVGFGFSAGTTEDKVMKSVASSDNKNFLAGVSDLSVVFDTIHSEIVDQAAGTGAVVTDPMGFNTDIAGGNNYQFKALIDASHPIVHTEPAGVTSSVTYDVPTESFNWVLTTGDIKEGTYTLEYYVQIQDVNGNGVGDNVGDVLTNHQAVLEYTEAPSVGSDEPGTLKRVPFIDPILQVEHYTVAYYFDGVINDSLTETQSAIAGRTPVTVVAPSFPGYDYDTTVYGNDSANTALDIIQDGENNIIKIYYIGTPEEDEFGTIPVTKTVEIPEGTTFNTPYTYYVALFDDNGGMYEDIAPIELTITDGNNLQASGSFTGLDLDKVYNVYEVYKVGDDFVKVETDDEDMVTSPEDTPWKATEYTNNEGIDEFGDDLTAPTVTVNNVYYSEEEPLLGAITVVKKVTVNKKAFNSKLTFHVGLFDSEDLTTPIDMKDLVMGGKSEVSVSFEELDAGTYYIAETDASGKPLAGTAKELGFEITVDGDDENLATVELIGDDVTVELVNNFKKEEFPLTGDNSNINLWIFLAMLGVAGAIAPFAFGKKEEAND